MIFKQAMRRISDFFGALVNARAQSVRRLEQAMRK